MGQARLPSLLRLDVLVASVRENPDLAAALTHPAIANDRRKSIGLAICASASASETLTRLLQMLIERERMAWLPEIARLYTELWNAQRGVARAEAITATTARWKHTDAAWGRPSGRRPASTVDVAGRTDPSVLGGVARADGRQDVRRNGVVASPIAAPNADSGGLRPVARRY